MFIVLNSCPSIHERLYWEATYGPKSKVVLKASNIIKKAEGNFKFDALKILAKITSILQFKHISYKSNSFGENIVLERKIVGIKGRVSIINVNVHRPF